MTYSVHLSDIPSADRLLHDTPFCDQGWMRTAPGMTLVRATSGLPLVMVTTGMTLATMALGLPLMPFLCISGILVFDTVHEIPLSTYVVVSL